MNNQNELLTDLKKQLETCAFMVSQGDDKQLIHSYLIKALVLVGQMEINVNNRDSSSDENNEVKKVEKRLKLWSKRKEQANSRILIGFLELKKRGAVRVNENDLRLLFKNDPSFNFDTNFSQMKNIAEKNHGKVFEINGNTVDIWPPVKSAVDEFEKSVFFHDEHPL